MAVMVIAQVLGQTQQGYDAMLAALDEPIRHTEGFIAHASHPVDDGWRVVELWRSKGDADRFFARHVAPMLPPGIRPKRTVHELHSLVTAPPGPALAPEVER